MIDRSSATITRIASSLATGVLMLATPFGGLIAGESPPSPRVLPEADLSGQLATQAPQWHTKVLFVPQRQFGMVVFTNGANGDKVIKAIISLAYDDPLFAATL